MSKTPAFMDEGGPLADVARGEAVVVDGRVGIVYGGDILCGLRVAVKSLDGWRHWKDVRWDDRSVRPLGMAPLEDLRTCGAELGLLGMSGLSKGSYMGSVAKHPRGAYAGTF